MTTPQDNGAGGALPPIPDVLALFGAAMMGLQNAAPEATDHLVKAGQELMLAAKALVDGMTEAMAQVEGHGVRTDIESIPIHRQG